MRTLTIIDDGVGIPTRMHERVFEPRVTSKLETMVMDRWGVHGRGMALFSVRSNVAEARVVARTCTRGPRSRSSPTRTQLPERADQSTWPVVERDEARQPKSRAAHTTSSAASWNSPSSIPARRLPRHPHRDPRHAVSDRARRARRLRPAVLRRRLAPAGLAAPGRGGRRGELIESPQPIGLAVSERTAHRILGRRAAPLETVLSSSLAADERRRRPRRRTSIATGAG